MRISAGFVKNLQLVAIVVVDSERMRPYRQDHLDSQRPLLVAVAQYVAGPRLLLEYLVEAQQGTQD